MIGRLPTEIFKRIGGLIFCKILSEAHSRHRAAPVGGDAPGEPSGPRRAIRPPAPGARCATFAFGARGESLNPLLDANSPNLLITIDLAKVGLITCVM